ncbi:CRTAC1 family protein [Edaphobacter bradus]|uniref:CRTAC1 family protein n=1 Tax=Edaphobacter bradus TaxID=2259016 RepID=UPI0021E0D0DE|nr:CRTAC1 family protein [Edaphobacter bradus]
MATGNGKSTPAKPLPPGMKAPVVRYQDIAAPAGLKGVNISGAEKGKQYIIETTGTGVAIIDYDNDGLPDIFVVNGGRLDDGQAPTHYLYHNLGGLKFEDVTAKAGLAHTGWGQGVCAGDVDNSGNVDLFVTQWGQNALYHNLGNGTFRDEAKERGLATEQRRWSTGCAFIDFNRDGFLDLVVAHYIEFDPAKTPRPGDKSQCRWKGLPVLCGPRGLPAETVSLYENDGHGHFKDVSDQLHVTTPKNYYGFTVLTGDFDNDGWPDIYVACDSTASLYYHNLGGKGFEEIAAKAGVAYNEDGREQAGMGVSAGDFNHDGQLDIFKTNFADDTHTLYRSEGDNNFVDATIDSGLAVNTRYLGWGTAFLDIDNDGWPDLIVANGHVYPEVEDGHTGERFKQQRLLYWNRRDGQFFDLSGAGGPGISDEHSSRGLAVGDLDNDGEQEIVIVNMGEAPTLLKNVAPVSGSSLTVRALTATGRDAIGARVTLSAGGHKQIDEVRSGGSFMSQSDLRLHFGLGKSSEAELTVRWLSGKTETFPKVGAGQIVTVQEGKGIVRKQPYTLSKK